MAVVGNLYLLFRFLVLSNKTIVHRWVKFCMQIDYKHSWDHMKYLLYVKVKMTTVRNFEIKSDRLSLTRKCSGEYYAYNCWCIADASFPL
jgi:hypothetical protein